MTRHEANFTLTFRHWLKENPMPTAAYELKQTRTDSIAFNKVQPHQLQALLAVRNGFFLYKIPDDSAGVKPFDMVSLEGELSFVVIKYPKFFCFITPQVFINEACRSKRKSLTAQRARKICTKAVDL